MMYYYLGLEARQRENVYKCLEEAVKDAEYISNRLKIPIRIFTMQENKKSDLVKVVRPLSTKRPLGKRIFEEKQ